MSDQSHGTSNETFKEVVKQEQDDGIPAGELQNLETVSQLNLMDEYMCPECGRSFANKHYLKNHMKVHVNERPYSCIVCNKTFKGSHDLDKHMTIHSDDRPKFRCEICSKEYFTTSYLQVHMRVHREERPYNCSHCDKTFTYQSAQLAHMKTHQDIKERAVFKCDICEKAYTKAGALAVHSRKHTGERPYKCKECGKTFAAHSTLYCHKRNMHSEVDDSGTCPICHKVFRKKSYIPYHIKSSHEGVKEHECPYCHEKFSRPYSVKVHIETAHSAPKHYQCDQCDRTFTNLSHMKIHSKTHKGLKDLVCSVCERTFGQKCHLAVHMKNAHKDVSPISTSFKCQLCTKTFPHKLNLMRHVRKIHKISPRHMPHVKLSIEDQTPREAADTDLSEKSIILGDSGPLPSTKCLGAQESKVLEENLAEKVPILKRQKSSEILQAKIVPRTGRQNIEDIVKKLQLDTSAVLSNSESKSLAARKGTVSGSVSSGKQENLVSGMNNSLSKQGASQSKSRHLSPQKRVDNKRKRSKPAKCGEGRASACSVSGVDTHAGKEVRSGDSSDFGEILTITEVKSGWPTDNIEGPTEVGNHGEIEDSHISYRENINNETINENSKIKAQSQTDTDENATQDGTSDDEIISLKDLDKPKCKDKTNDKNAFEGIAILLDNSSNASGETGRESTVVPFDSFTVPERVVKNKAKKIEQASSDRVSLQDLSTEELLECLETDNSISECECSLIFTDPIMYFLHRNLHGQGGSLRCGFCNHEASDKYFFMIHQVQAHKCSGS